MTLGIDVLPLFTEMCLVKLTFLQIYFNLVRTY